MIRFRHSLYTRKKNIMKQNSGILVLYIFYIFFVVDIVEKFIFRGRNACGHFFIYMLNHEWDGKERLIYKIYFIVIQIYAFK